MPRYTDNQIEAAVKASTSVMGVLRLLGIRQTGGSHGHVKRRIDRLGFDIKHFTGRGHNKGKPSNRKKLPEELLIKRENGRRPFAARLRRALIEAGVPYKCLKCNLEPMWHDTPLTLEIDHINNDWTDDRKENLRFLCPNCHSQVSMHP